MPFFSTTNLTNSDGTSVSAARASSAITFSNASIFASSPARSCARPPAASLPSVTLPIPRAGVVAARNLSTSLEGSIARRIHARASLTSLRAKNLVPRILYGTPARNNPSSRARDWKFVRYRIAISSGLPPSDIKFFILSAIHRASSSAFNAIWITIGSPADFSVVEYFSFLFLFFSMTAFAASTRFLVER